MIEQNRTTPVDKMEEILFAVGRAENQQLPFEQWKQDIVKKAQQKKLRRVRTTRMLASAAALVLLLGGVGIMSRINAGHAPDGADGAAMPNARSVQQYDLVLQNVNTYDQDWAAAPSGEMTQFEDAAVAITAPVRVDYMLYLPCS